MKETNQTFITTHEALQEENRLIAKTYAMKGNFKPINDMYIPKDEKLNDEQVNAITHALSSSDGITIIAGKAGTGKTTLMKEVQNGIYASGKKFYAFAPSAEASRMVQRREGFENANTVASLLQNKASQGELKNSIIWVDEAGMLSNKDMNKLLDIAQEQNARLILTGDTKQHNSVERGDALRILQTEAGITSVQVSKIQRQKNRQYKEAVKYLSAADIEKGFKKLEKIGAIHEIENSQDRIEQIANDYYTSSFTKGKKATPNAEVLVVSPTHAEGEMVTERIREKLKKENRISSDERQFQVFKNLQLTAAEKEKTENYTSGRWLIFHQNCKGFKAGSKYQVVQAKDKGIVELQDVKGKISSISIDKAANYNLFEIKNLTVSKGDRIRITGNGKSKEGRHLFNGNMYKIEDFDPHGNMRLSNGSMLPWDYGHFTSGYVVTSHASQGKTVDKVIISQSSLSFKASSAEQFYVSVSRGRQGVSIYTDDKTALLQAVSKSNQRKSATELLKSSKSLSYAITVNRNNFLQRIREKIQAAVQLAKDAVKNHKSFEYELQR